MAESPCRSALVAAAEPVCHAGRARHPGVWKRANVPSLIEVALVTINFESPDGRVRSVAANPGQSVMEAARAADVTGIVAVCGGKYAVRNLHIVVAEDWSERIRDSRRGRGGGSGGAGQSRGGAAVEPAGMPDPDVGRIRNGLTVRVPSYQPGI